MKNRNTVKTLALREASKKVYEAIGILNGLYDVGLIEDGTELDSATANLDTIFWTLSFHEEN